jgi:acyl-coenzyme A synthetase/AMP-(fatty) acid ligase
MYGLTECARGSYLPPALINERPDSVGISIPNEEVWIENDDGRRLGADETGELVIRGSNVMQGYWRDPKETAIRFKGEPGSRDRLLYTGDLFCRDGDGYLYFVSRKDDLINTKGERVSPREIETCICEFEGIVEAAVVGVPDQILGQAIKACVVPAGPDKLDKPGLKRHLKKNLEPFMLPALIEIRASLPKLFNGKIDRKQLCS